MALAAGDHAAAHDDQERDQPAQLCALALRRSAGCHWTAGGAGVMNLDAHHDFPTTEVPGQTAGAVGQLV